MTNAINKPDLDIQTRQQLVDSLARDFGKIYDALEDKPAVREMLDSVWQKVVQLHVIGDELDALFAGAEAAMKEVARQRDLAIFDAATWKKHGFELASRILAGHIAVDGEIPVQDVMRVLDVLSGKNATTEEPRLRVLYERIRDLANALYEEQTYTAASADRAED